MTFRFVDYYGKPVSFDNDHIHVVEDTINTSGTTAVATSTTDGFFSNSDKVNLNTIENQILLMSDKIKQAVYIKPVSQEDVNLSINRDTSVLMSQVYYAGQVSNGLNVDVTAKTIGTLSYHWEATWYYKGPNWDYNDPMSFGYFLDVTGNTISLDYLINLTNNEYQPYSVLEGTVTITNTVEDKSSTITESFFIYFN